MLSNLMNIGKKKPSSLDNPEKCVDTSGEESSCARGSFECTDSPSSQLLSSLGHIKHLSIFLRNNGSQPGL